MQTTNARPQLHVEGMDDLHTVVHVVRNHGIDYDVKPWPENFPQVKSADGYEKLIELMPVAVRAAATSIVGFVVDADTGVAARWQSIRDVLTTVDVQSPAAPMPDGFIGKSARFQTRVGVWLMPDNVRDGALEHLLRDLISASDPLIKHAETSTGLAVKLGAGFSSSSHPKAILHTWLSWQKEPGQPYGTAIRCKYFDTDAALAIRFAKWYRELYAI